jgi:ankyrin repeat protein
LFVASQIGHLDVVRELLARGANANAAFDTGATPLIQASWNGHVDVVRALLAAGADKHHVANNGATATSVAGNADGVTPAAKAAVLVLLATAP